MPIDINIVKLLDWVLDRRVCPRDWQKSVLPVRNKIALAIQDMPEHDDITNLLNGTSMFSSFSLLLHSHPNFINEKDFIFIFKSYKLFQLCENR